MGALMNHRDLTQGEMNALRRVSSGSDVDFNMWQDLSRKGLVEVRDGKKTMTERGKRTLRLFD